MDFTNLLLLVTGYTIIICCKHTNGHLERNATNSVGDVSNLSNKERFRRLIPYMTFYLDQGYNTQNQYITQAPQDFQAVPSVHNNLQPQPYYVPQYQQPKLQLVPLGYLVGGGYRRTPVYSRPSQPDYNNQGTYTPQHPSDLTRMIAQNYHSMVKEVNDQTKDQRPAQYTTKLEYANQNQHHNQGYKAFQGQTKTYFQPRHRFQPNHNRQPYLVKNYQPSYTSLKDNSYVQLHNNYDVNNYDTVSKVKNYEPVQNVMTITKSQEIDYPVEENSVPEPVQVPIPESTPASLSRLQNHYEQSLPTVPASLTQLQSDYEPSVPTVPTNEQNDLLDILSSYHLSKVLPDKVTPSNIGYSIRTLSNILKLLEKAKAQTSEEFSSAHGVDDDYSNGVGQSFSPYQTEGSTPGRAGVDYPAYAEIPETEFTCKSQRYKGFFADPDTNCQVWHYCDLNGGQASFLCPNGTIFSQVALTCDWWFNVKCAATAQQYVLNERLYKYILPVKPSFPEDYAGPLVDEYLTLKFQELEAKKQNTTTTEKTTNTLQVLLNDEINQSVK